MLFRRLELYNHSSKYCLIDSSSAFLEARMCNRSNVRRNARVNRRCVNNFTSPLKRRITDDNDNAGDYFIIPAYARSRGLIKLTSGLSRRVAYASDSFEGAIQRARRVSSRAKDTPRRAAFPPKSRRFTWSAQPTLFPLAREVNSPTTATILRRWNPSNESACTRMHARAAMRT